MQLCDSIGTPVDSHTTNIQCNLVAINSNAVINIYLIGLINFFFEKVVVASTDSFIVWHYSIPRQDNTNISTNLQGVANNKNLTSEQNDKFLNLIFKIFN